MTTVTTTWRKPMIGLLVAGTVAGCGVVYTPQEFEESIVSYGYKGGYEGAIKLVSMNFFSARLANSDGYVPRSLPDTFSQQEPIVTVSTRDQLAQAGLDQVSPALQFEPPTRLPSFDADRQALSPVLRDENRQPLPSTNLELPDFDGRASERAYGGTSGGAYGGTGGRRASSSMEGVENLRNQLRPPIAPRTPSDRPIPTIQPEEYLIGPGDVIGILSRLQSMSVSQPAAGDLFSDAAKELLVQGSGEIYIPQAGSVDVGGLTLTEARSVIFDRLVDNQLDFDFGVEILRFGSKTIAVSGESKSLILPVTVKPTTLGDAIFAVGGIGSDPGNTVVRVLREGEIYEMVGDEVFGPRDIGKRYLKEGDVVSISPIYDIGRSLDYFDQQLRLREFERSERAFERSEREFERSERVFERSELEFDRAERGDAREELKFQIELENYRLQAEKLRQESEISRFLAQDASNRANEEARIANIEARQAYLDRLRLLQQANAEALRDFENGRRETLIANIEERARERRERRELLELELQEERLRFTAERDQAQEERTLFNERVRLGAVQQDYVTVAGETNKQTVMPLPFNGKMTLNRVLYEETNGLNLLTADSSEIYVIRTSNMMDPTQDPLTAYHLDASNPAALAVASMFEMRPNDVVYVNPQPVTNWNRVVSSILPSTGLLSTGLTTATGL